MKELWKHDNEKKYLGLTHPLFLNQAILESGNERSKQLNKFDGKLDQALLIIGSP